MTRCATGPVLQCGEGQGRCHRHPSLLEVTPYALYIHPVMKRLQAFKYELMATGEQQRQMRRFAGACRVVFNEALALQKTRHERGEKKLGYAGLCKELTTWRNGAPLPSGRRAPWLAEAPVHPLQQALKDLERAYTNFFARRADFPRTWTPPVCQAFSS